MNLCDDNRIITIEKAKQELIKGTNIEDSPEEMKVLDSFLLLCWQMGWLERYAPPRHFNALPKGISERMAAGHGSNVPMQPNIPPMPSNTSNALEALESVNATQSNALDCISRQQAIREMREVCNPSIARFMRAKLALEALQPVAIRLKNKNTVDLPETEGSDPSQIAAQIIHDAIDNTTFAEEAYPGIKEQMHRSVEEWEKLQPVFTEIAEEYRKACEISYINKPLAYALHEVWKKHDRRDTNRNETKTGQKDQRRI